MNKFKPGDWLRWNDKSGIIRIEDFNKYLYFYKYPNKEDTTKYSREIKYLERVATPLTTEEKARLI